MSRTKKSRKPGVGKREVIKDTAKTVVAPHAKKPKKKTGKQAGNRQQEAFATKKQTQKTNTPKDPRVGSKTPIDLTPVNTPKVQQPRKEKPSPIAAIKVIEPVVSSSTLLEDELYAIEADTQLQEILALQEDDVTLNEVQIDYFNSKMERHQELRELLGWNDEDEDDEDDLINSTKSEDDLWDSLDNNDLSKFE